MSSNPALTAENQALSLKTRPERAGFFMPWAHRNGFQ